jgi:hypothetical protein
MRIRSLQLSLMVALAAALAAAPADAQGKGKGKDKNRERTEQVRFREDDRRRDDDDRWDDDDVRLERRDRRQVPPGWCRGKGNPHNTPENCGNARDRRRYEDRRDDDRRYEDGRYDDRYGRYGSSGSYQEAHQAFHREHDRTCRERASQRAFDPVWQLRVRNECKVEHDRWHASTGTRH